MRNSSCLFLNLIFTCNFFLFHFFSLSPASSISIRVPHSFLTWFTVALCAPPLRGMTIGLIFISILEHENYFCQKKKSIDASRRERISVKLDSNERHIKKHCSDQILCPMEALVAVACYDLLLKNRPDVSSLVTTHLAFC